MTLKYFAEKPIIVELPPTPVTALFLLVLECTEFIEPYIPEDQERDEATGQPKKKARLGDVRDESANGGSPASQHAVMSTSFTVPSPVNNTNGTPTSRSEAVSHYPSVLDHPVRDLNSNRVHPYMPRPNTSHMPSPRPYASTYSPSPWSPIGSAIPKTSIPTLPQVPSPHPYATTPTSRPVSAAHPHSNGNTPTISATTTPTIARPLLPSSVSVPLPNAGRPELPQFGPRPVSAAELTLAVQASLDRQHEDKLQEAAKARQLQSEREREKWEEMKAKAASIVETVRKEGINGGFM
jgi:hypothetical protein